MHGWLWRAELFQRCCHLLHRLSLTFVDLSLRSTAGLVSEWGKVFVTRRTLTALALALGELRTRQLMHNHVEGECGWRQVRCPFWHGKRTLVVNLPLTFLSLCFYCLSLPKTVDRSTVGCRVGCRQIDLPAHETAATPTHLAMRAFTGHCESARHSSLSRRLPT